MKFLDEPHYYATNVELDIPLDYLHSYIDSLDDSDWVNHKSTKSGRDTEIWYTMIIRPEKFSTLPDDHMAYKFPVVNQKWDPAMNSKLPQLQYSMIILKINANDHMKPHTDGQINPRKTVWSFPLSGEYAPVRFYDNFDEECTDEYTGQMFLNTANIHEVNNGPTTRYNLQICFEDDIDTVYNAHKELLRD